MDKLKEGLKDMADTVRRFPSALASRVADHRQAPARRRGDAEQGPRGRRRSQGIPRPLRGLTHAQTDTPAGEDAGTAGRQLEVDRGGQGAGPAPGGASPRPA